MKEEGLFQTEKIVLNDRFDITLDYFLTKVSIPHIFISERLKKSIEGEGFNWVEHSGGI